MLLTEVAQSNEVLPVVYPDVALPITKKTLDALYKEFNKKYFANKLRNVKLGFTSSAKHFGVTRPTTDASGGIATITVLMNKGIQSNRKKFIDTLLHEMVHVWQFEQYHTTRDVSYLDNKASIKGHGSTFERQMNIINGRGFGIEKRSDASHMEIPLTYIIAIRTISKFIIFKSPTNFFGSEKKMLDELGKLYGDALQSYSTYTSESTHVLSLPTLTKALGIGRNTKRIFMTQDVIDKIAADKTTKQISKDIDISHSAIDAGVPGDVVAQVKRLHTNIRALTFADYLTFAIKNTALSTTQIPAAYQYPSKIESLPQDVIDYIYADWREVSATEIKRTESTTMITTQISNMLAGTADIRDVADLVDKAFTIYFEERMKRAAYTKILFAKLLSIVVARLKKAPQAYNQEFVGLSKAEITKTLHTMLAKAL